MKNINILARNTLKSSDHLSTFMESTRGLNVGRLELRLMHYEKSNRCELSLVSKIRPVKVLR